MPKVPSPKRQRPSDKPDDHVNRSPNAFILWKSEYLKDKRNGQQNLSTTALGKMWKALPESQKKFWYARADEEKAKLLREHPDYKYKPNRDNVKNKAKKTSRAIKQPPFTFAAQGTGPSSASSQAVAFQGDVDTQLAQMKEPPTFQNPSPYAQPMSFDHPITGINEQFSELSAQSGSYQQTLGEPLDASHPDYNNDCNAAFYKHPYPYSDDNLSDGSYGMSNSPTLYEWAGSSREHIAYGVGASNFDNGWSPQEMLGGLYPQTRAASLPPPTYHEFDESSSGGQDSPQSNISAPPTLTSSHGLSSNGGMQRSLMPPVAAKVESPYPSSSSFAAHPLQTPGISGETGFGHAQSNSTTSYTHYPPPPYDFGHPTLDITQMNPHAQFNHSLLPGYGQQSPVLLHWPLNSVSASH